MKFTKKKYPGLEEVWEIIKHDYYIKPGYISESFFNEAVNNQHVFEEDEELYTKEIYDTTFLFFDKGGNIFYGVFPYVLKWANSGKLAMEIKTENYFSPILSEIKQWTNPRLKTDWSPMKFFAFIRLVLLFMKYSQVKHEVLPPKSKTKLIHGNYKNKFGFSIALLDKNYYTQSIQKSPFLVRGHLRLQPHGIGNRKKKVIWIDPFMKRGYTKGAYKDKQL